jgi:hypothetical protein
VRELCQTIAPLTERGGGSVTFWDDRLSRNNIPPSGGHNFNGAPAIVRWALALPPN